MATRIFKPTATFRKKEEQVRQSVYVETKEILRKDIEKLFQDPQHSDLLLCVGSRQLPVHSCILSARHRQLYDYFRDHTEDNKVVINGLSFEDLERCLYSIYSKDSIDCSDVEKALSLKDSKTSKDCSLSADLLSLLDSGTGDVDFIIEEKVVKAHKAILASRSNYFAAMFSASWKEMSSSSITIPDVNYDIFVAALKFVYGASQDILTLKTSKILKFTDMYGIEGLQTMTITHLKITKCHLFHKPCSHCIPQVYECLKLCEEFYHLETLKSQCIKWISKNFEKILPCKLFSSMPDGIQGDVRMEIEKELSASTALETWRKCVVLKTSVTNYRTEWARSVEDFVSKIQATCLNVAIEHFVPICNSFILDSFLKETNYSSSWLEQFLNSVLETLTVQNCCNVLQGLLVLIKMAEDPKFRDPFDSGTFAVVEKSCRRCERYIIGSIGQVSKTKAWEDICANKQKELKDAAFFVDL